MIRSAARNGRAVVVIEAMAPRCMVERILLAPTSGRSFVREVGVVTGSGRVQQGRRLIRTEEGKE